MDEDIFENEEPLKPEPDELETPNNPYDDPEIPEEPEEDDVESEEDSTYYYQSIPDFYDRVRGSLNSSSINITNDMIDYPENAPFSELKMKLRVPNWEELDKNKTSLFQTCIVYMTCYALCPIAYSKNVTEQTTPGLSLKYSDNVPQNPCERFLALIDELVAMINEEEMQSFFGFKVTQGSPKFGCNRIIDNKIAFIPLGSE